MVPVLRDATNADANAIRRLVFSVLGEYGLTPDPECTDADLKDIEANYLQPGGMFVVLVASGEVVGSAGLYRMDASTCELRKMYIDPRFRGMGLGTLLLDRCIADAQRLGFKEIVLETASVLKEALRLYERYGFRPCERGHLASRCDIAMRLKLDQ